MEKIRVGEVGMECGTCSQEIPVPVDVWIDGDRLVADTDMSGLWLHSWTHSEEAKA